MKPQISISRMEKYAAAINRAANVLKVVRASARIIDNAPIIQYEHIGRISNLTSLVKRKPKALLLKIS